MPTATASTFNSQATKSVGSSSRTKPELRVLQVFSVLGVGGAETWLMALLKYFRERNEELPVTVKFDILLTGGEKSVFDDDAAALGAKIFYVPYRREKLGAFVRDFRQVLSLGRYDALHDHQDTNAGLHFLFGVGLLPPIRIAHFHNAFEAYPRGIIRKANFYLGRRLVGNFASHISGTALAVLDQYGVRVSASRLPIRDSVHCGFEVSSFKGNHRNVHSELCDEFGWNDDVKIILFAGRLEKRKNPHFALEVASECIRRRPEVRLLMAGAGEEIHRTLEAQIRALRLERQIRLLGSRSDIARLMLGSNVFLFPSLAEGLGMVLAEAQASGLPILASDSTPLESVVIPEIVRFLSLSEGPASWATEVLRLIDQDRPDVSKCNNAVQGSAFSIEASASRLVQMYGDRRSDLDQDKLRLFPQPSSGRP